MWLLQPSAIFLAVFVVRTSVQRHDVGSWMVKRSLNEAGRSGGKKIMQAGVAITS